MKKVLTKAVVLLLAMAVCFSGAGLAVAQETQDDVEAQVMVLAVDTPGSAYVADPVTITVTIRGSERPVADASVYALSWPRLSVSDADTGCWPPAYACLFLGVTGSDGKVEYTFERPGRFLIVATKDGFGPGLGRLAVKTQFLGRLKIEAPARAPVNELVEMKVVNKNDGQGVAGADVWAISLPHACALTDKAIPADEVKTALEGLRLADVEDLEGFLSAYGFYLGPTGDDGSLEYAFEEVGRYVLVATKDGYVPGVKRITVVADKALAIRGPRMAEVGEVVTFTSVTRGSGTVVEGVALYALSWPFCGAALMTPIEAGETSWLEQLATDDGEYLGVTNLEGELDHSFSEEGMYIIVGIKEGYVPGVGFIRIGEVNGLAGLMSGVRSRISVARGLERSEAAVPQLTQWRARKLGQWGER